MNAGNLIFPSKVITTKHLFIDENTRLCHDLQYFSFYYTWGLMLALLKSCNSAVLPMNFMPVYKEDAAQY